MSDAVDFDLVELFQGCNLEDSGSMKAPMVCVTVLKDIVTRCVATKHFDAEHLRKMIGNLGETEIASERCKFLTSKSIGFMLQSQDVLNMIKKSRLCDLFGECVKMLLSFMGSHLRNYVNETDGQEVIKISKAISEALYELQNTDVISFDGFYEPTKYVISYAIDTISWMKEEDLLTGKINFLAFLMTFTMMYKRIAFVQKLIIDQIVNKMLQLRICLDFHSMAKMSCVEEEILAMYLKIVKEMLKNLSRKQKLVKFAACGFVRDEDQLILVAALHELTTASTLEVNIEINSCLELTI